MPKFTQLIGDSETAVGTLVYSDGRTYDLHSTKLPPGKGSLSIDATSHTGYLTYLNYNALGIKEYKETYFTQETHS